jgi:hypothetical protein
MSFFNVFTRPRYSSVESGTINHVQGDTFDPGAEAFGTLSTIGDPLYELRVFPQWNFTPLEVYQSPMVFQELSLPADLPAGYPFGGMRSTNLIHESDYPDVTGDYFS